ncbi:MAG TPA: cytochrome c3 family protein [Polyangiaceae bacterium]|jgi:hypothetical protein
MRPLFSPASDTLFRLALTVVATAALAVPTAMMLWVRTPYVTKEGEVVEQPIEFDHRHHVRDEGIDCLYCHYEAARAKSAGVPPTAVCMHCHAQVWQRAGRLAPVRASFFDDRPLHWRRVHQLPDFVYFDHSAHVTHGVGCVECHGRVDLMAAVRAGAPLTMKWCLDCHRDPTPRLRPASAVTDMEWKAPPGWTPDLLPNHGHVEPPVDCAGCHR